MNKKKIIYSILKELEKGERPNYSDYDLSLEEFGSILEIMIDEKLIKNCSVVRYGKGNMVKGYLLKNATVTMDGLNFLDENNLWSKTYKTIKEIREWIKL